ncbi:acyltransferase [Bacillus infantis]|uniref:acyltransferase n=1 Tax=Bacillus infantis TaxID=324767 RepID=UPI0039826588
MNKLVRILAIGFINHMLCTTRFWNTKRKLLTIAGIKVGKESKIVGPIHIGSVANLSIGDNCWIGSNIHIYGNGSVVIGDNCDLAPDISFVTGSHTIGTSERRAGNGLSYNILVQSGCWIGARATIMGDTVINNGVIVGACSLVNKDINDNTLVVGVPAKPVRNLK